MSRAETEPGTNDPANDATASHRKTYLIVHILQALKISFATFAAFAVKAFLGAPLCPWWFKLFPEPWNRPLYTPVSLP
jgi:hypothetical protein